jgi:nitroreductase
MHMTDATTITRFLRDLRQVRRFTDEPVPEEALRDILEVARWTGSAKNTQPWHFLVIRDRETLRTLAGMGNFTAFIAGVPLAIGVVLHGDNARTEPYDHGRVEERMMLAAKAHGLGSGTAWYDPEAVREMLDVPEPYVLRSLVGIGYPADGDHSARSVSGGRKPLDELVRHERFGAGQ